MAYQRCLSNVVAESQDHDTRHEDREAEEESGATTTIVVIVYRASIPDAESSLVYLIPQLPKKKCKGA